MTAGRGRQAPTRLGLAILALACAATGDAPYESAVPACADTGPGGISCGGARRWDLDDGSADVLALLETDADCIDAAEWRADRLALRADLPPAFLATCGLPAVLSLQVFAIAQRFRAGCAGHPGVHGQACNLFETVERIQSTLYSYRAEAARAAAALDLSEHAAPLVRRYIHEATEGFSKQLMALGHPRALQRWLANPPELGAAALEVCRDLGLARRVLFWRANTVLGIEGFGFAGRLAHVAPRNEFFHSRQEVLLDLLGGPPAHGKVFVEVGVHLARLAYAMLGLMSNLVYIGVDPFVYDEALTDAESRARQLRDLGLAPEKDGAQELKSAVRLAAEEKLSYFGHRAQLLAQPSTEAAALVQDASVDGVFIDGDHSYIQVLRDIEAWEPKVRPGGFLAGHDFGNHPDVMRAVFERAAAGNRTVHLSMDWVWYWYV